MSDAIPVSLDLFVVLEREVCRYERGRHFQPQRNSNIADRLGATKIN